MASVRTNFTVGIFLIVGIALLIASIIYFGLTGFNEKGQFYVAYFDESVQGLSKDSPVKYRGVTIGRVDSITVAPDATLIQATLKVESQVKPDEKMVAQLKSVGITGIMFVELDQKKPSDPPKTPRITFPTKYTVIPTKPSDIKHLLGSINDIVDTIKGLDLNGISNNALAVLATIDKMINNVDKMVTDLKTDALKKELSVALDNWNQTLAVIKGAGHQFQDLTRDLQDLTQSFEGLAQNLQGLPEQLKGSVELINQTISHLDHLLLDNQGAVTEALAEINNTLDGSTKLMATGQTLFVGTRQQLQQVENRLQGLLRSLNISAQKLTKALETIANQPASLIFSAPPPPRQLQPSKGK